MSSTRSKQKDKQSPQPTVLAKKTPENSWIFCLKKDILDSQENFTIITLPHPVRSKMVKYCLDEANKKVYEIMMYDEPHRSWFIGESVKSDGKIYFLTPVDSTFLVLPLLRDQCRTRAVPLEDLLTEKSYIKILDYVLNLDHVADLKGTTDMKAYKYNEEKTLSWLQSKVEKVAAVLKAKNVQVSTGAVSTTFVISTRDEEKLDEGILRVDGTTSITCNARAGARADPSAVGFLREHKGARSARLDGVRDGCVVWTLMMWSDEQSLELISLYQDKPVIWNPKNPDYFKKNIKNDAWSDIAHSLGRDVEECKNKMISLLASHRREKGKEKKSHMSGKEFYLKYAYGIISDYLEEELTKLLEKRLDFKPDLIETLAKKRKSQTNDTGNDKKKIKTENLDMDQKENSFTSPDQNNTSMKISKPAILTTKEKARIKAASGTKTISSFFVKK